MPDFYSANSLSPNFPGAPMQASGSLPLGASPMNFNDVLSRLNSATTAGSDYFNKGVSTLSPSGSLAPGTQQILDLIQKKGDLTRQRAVAAATGLAARRGLSGSSIEQAGVTNASTGADQATIDAQTQAMLQDAQQQNSLRLALGQGYFGQSGTQTDLAKTGAQLSSDELASQRNYDFAQQQLRLQQLLGQQGIDVAKGNIDASKDIANKNALYGLLSGAGSSILPHLLFPNSFGGGGSNGFFGASGTSGGLFGPTAGGAPYAAGSTAGPFAPGMAPGVGGINPFLGSAAIVGAGYGASQLSKAAGDVTKSAGNTVSSAAATLANPIGAQLNKVKSLFTGNVASNVSSAVSRTFGGAGKTADGNAIADTSRGLYTQMDQLKALKAKVASGELSQADYLAQAQPAIDQAAQAVGSTASRGSTYANAVNKIWNEFKNAGLVTAQGNQWVAA